MENISIIDLSLLESCLVLLALNTFQFLHSRRYSRRIDRLKSSVVKGIKKAQSQSSNAIPRQAATDNPKAVKHYIDYLNEEIESVRKARLEIDKYRGSVLDRSQPPEDLILKMRESFLIAERDVLDFPINSLNYWDRMGDSFGRMLLEAKNALDCVDIENTLVNEGSEEDVDYYKARIKTLEKFRTLFISLEKQYNELQEEFEEKLVTSHPESLNTDSVSRLPSITDNAVLESTNSALVKKVKDLTTTLHDKRLDAKVLESDLVAAETKMAALKKKIHALEQQQGHPDDIPEAQSSKLLQLEVHSLKSSLKEARIECRTADQSRLDAQAAIDALQVEIRTLRKELDVIDASTGSSNRPKDLDKTRNNQQSDLSDSAQDGSYHEQRIKSLEKFKALYLEAQHEISTLQDQLSTAPPTERRDSFTDTSKPSREIKVKVEQLNRQLRESKRLNEVLELDLTQAQSSNTKLLHDMRSLTSNESRTRVIEAERDALQDKVTKYTQDALQMKIAISMLEKENEELGTLEKLKEESQIADQKIMELNEFINKNMKEAQEMMTCIFMLENEVSDLKSSLDSSPSTVQLEHELQRVKAQLEIEAQNTTAQDEKMVALLAERSKLVQQIQKFKNELKSHENTPDNETVKKLAQELNLIKSERNHLREEYAQLEESYINLASKRR